MFFNSIFTIFFAFLFLAPGTLSVCYHPDGSVAPQDTPCTDETEQSTCCGQGYACLSNKICKATGEEFARKGAAAYNRGSCTDKEWRSADCPLFCIAPRFNNVRGHNGIGKYLNTNQDRYYCIGSGNKADNCSLSANPLIFQGQPSIITTIGVTATATNTPPSDSSSDGGKTVAIAVGVAVPLVLIGVGILAWLVWRRKKAHKAQSDAALSGHPDGFYGDDAKKYQPQQTGMSELPEQTEQPMELPTETAMSELPSSVRPTELSIPPATHHKSNPGSPGVASSEVSPAPVSSVVSPAYSPNPGIADSRH